ncbi:unnamed protein product [Owenia fusiformis]|uniref:Uncharacterized protein n=1 Tax=Owenia fusiformis TaxID=6347 RepID=A0A8S4PTN5_OWEFU|nr:unnamed protein product [Owenia fusiformis]
MAPASDLGLDHETELEVLLAKFPEFSCICEICDCGRCLKNHKCKKKRNVQKREAPLGKTDYQTKFSQPGVPRPRSTKRPPPTPREVILPPMMFDTNQRSEFKGHKDVPRVKPFILSDNYETPSDPIDGTTYYMKEFPGKMPQDNVKVKINTDSTSRYMRDSSAKFDGRTTNKEEFKKYTPQQNLSFKELPSFAGSILYPEKPTEIQSNNQASYPGFYLPRRSEIRQTSGNIRIEGDMHMETTNRDIFRGAPGSRAKLIVHKPEMGRNNVKRGKFDAQTQMKSDFQMRGGEPADAAKPAPETIRLRFNDNHTFSTEQRTMFKGVDVGNHPPAEQIKLVDNYEPSTDPMETRTNNMMDYKPVDLKAAHNPRVSMPASKSTEHKPKFDGQTMNNIMFKDPKVKQRVRYVDFHEGHTYVPPSDKFNGHSTTKSTFVPLKADPVINYKPDQKPIVREGSVDYNTVHKSTYKGQKVQLCKSKIYLLQQELKRREALEKANKSNKANSRQVSVS